MFKALADFFRGRQAPRRALPPLGDLKVPLIAARDQAAAGAREEFLRLSHRQRGVLWNACFELAQNAKDADARMIGRLACLGYVEALLALAGEGDPS